MQSRSEILMNSILYETLKLFVSTLSVKYRKTKARVYTLRMKKMEIL